MRTSFALLILLCGLCGCGFKGPLYLPDRTAEGAKARSATPAVPVITDEQRPVPSEAVPAPK